MSIVSFIFSIGSMPTFSYIPSSSRLQHYVTMVWELFGDQDVKETILPQGIVEIVFNFADKVEGFLPFSKTSIRAPRCFIQGMHTHMLHAEYTGRHHLLGIRLHPHQVYDLVGVLPAEINNNSVDLALLRPGFDRVWHQLAGMKTFTEKLQLLEKELPQLAESTCGRSQMLSNLFLSDHSEGFETVDHLAKQVCWSPRQLSRVTQNLFGFSAEDLVTYKKFLQSVKMIHLDHKSLTDIAYRSGFYDQAHFCRVFKSYTGMTPNHYRKRKGILPFHLLGEYAEG